MNRKKLIRIFKQVVFFNKVVFPYLVVLAFFSLSIETYTYIGFLRKHFLIDAKFLLVITMVSGLLLIRAELKSKKQRKGLLEQILRLNVFLFPFILVINFILLMAEVIRYPNYVFTKVHLQPKNFIFVSFLSFFIAFIYVYKNTDTRRLKLPKELSKKQIFRSEILRRSILIATDYYPLTWLFTYVFILLEAFIYPGALVISAYIPITATIIFGFISHIFAVGKRTTRLGIFNRSLVIFSKISIPLSIFLFLYFDILETTNYSNYVFSTYHLHYTRLLLLAGLGIYYIFMQRKTVFTYNDLLLKDGLIRIIVLIPLLVMGFYNLVETTPKVTDEAILTIKYAGKPYDDKMRARWKDFYDYMLFIKDNTPENAVLFHPPQEKPWEFEGNQVLIRYFLYPRKLVSGLIDIDEYEGPTITHVLIVWGRERPVEDNEYGWPKRAFEGKKILLFEEEYSGPSIYEPENEVFVRKRGLIEL